MCDRSTVWVEVVALLQQDNPRSWCRGREAGRAREQTAIAEFTARLTLRQLAAVRRSDARAAQQRTCSSNWFRGATRAQRDDHVEPLGSPSGGEAFGDAVVAIAIVDRLPCCQPHL